MLVIKENTGHYKKKEGICLKILHINSNYLHSPLYSEMLRRLEYFNIYNDVIMPRKKADNKHLNSNLLETNSKIYNSQIINKADRFLYFRKQRKINNWVKSLEVDYTKYDIVHAHTLFSDGYQAYISNRPYVVTIRNTDVNYYLKYFKHLYPVAKNIINKAKKIIFLSESYKEKFLVKLFKNENTRSKVAEKSIVIPNGINDFWINNANNENKVIKDEINVLFIGRIMKNKNIDFIARNLNDENFNKKINIYVIGEVIENEYYEKLKRFHNVVFLGKKSKNELINIMKSMHIFAMVSFHETFGLVYLEALTQNLPLLYTKNEGFDNYFENGRVGYAVNPNNDEELIDKFKKIYKEYNSLQVKISNINKNAFSWESNARNHQKIYINILNEN